MATNVGRGRFRWFVSLEWRRCLWQRLRGLVNATLSAHIVCIHYVFRQYISRIAVMVCVRSHWFLFEQSRIHSAALFFHTLDNLLWIANIYKSMCAWAFDWNELFYLFPRLCDAARLFVCAQRMDFRLGCSLRKFDAFKIDKYLLFICVFWYVILFESRRRCTLSSQWRDTN